MKLFLLFCALAGPPCAWHELPKVSDVSVPGGYVFPDEASCLKQGALLRISHNGAWPHVVDPQYRVMDFKCAPSIP